MSQNEIVKSIKEKEILIEEFRVRINSMYNSITTALQVSGGVRTSEIEETYKKIDSAFGTKSKLEGDVRNLKKNLLEMMLSE